MLSRKAVKVLEAMAKAEDEDEWDEAELVREGRSCWLGYTRVSGKTIDELLTCVAVRTVSEPGAVERYLISGTGRAILKDPEVAVRVMRAISEGRAVDSAGNPL